MALISVQRPNSGSGTGRESSQSAPLSDHSTTMVKTLEDKLASLTAERRAKIEARTAELIAEEMSLRELHQATGKTQAKVAAELGVGQDSVAGYEQRIDMLLSTNPRAAVRVIRRVKRFPCEAGLPAASHSL
jgi:hypothetical protein